MITTAIASSHTHTHKWIKHSISEGTGVHNPHHLAIIIISIAVDS